MTKKMTKETTEEAIEDKTEETTEETTNGLTNDYLIKILKHPTQSAIEVAQKIKMSTGN